LSTSLGFAVLGVAEFNATLRPGRLFLSDISLELRTKYYSPTISLAIRNCGAEKRPEIGEP
jgi:hypothetical protein